MDYDWILTDFAAHLPVEQADATARPHRWQLVRYRAEDFAGAMIMANPGVEAPEIRIPLPLVGRYDIYLGFFENYGDRLKVKLASDRCYERLAPSAPFGNAPGFQDVYWRTLDLTGNEAILLKQDTTHRAAVGYVLARTAEERPVGHGRYLLHVTDDGFPSNWGMPDDREDQRWLAEHLVGLGAGFISLGIDISGMANYATRHDALRLPTAEILRDGVFSHEHWRQALEIVDGNIREGYQAPRRYYEVVKARGAQAFGYSRMAHVYPPPPYDAVYSTLYAAHPEYRCIDISGVPVNRLSYAFPEVRRALITLFTEQVEMGADGINAVFVRGLPAVCYEEPVRARFRELYGEDCTTLPEDDLRAQAVRAEFVTTFMRELRQALDAAGAGRNIAVLVSVPATREICAFFGLDLQTWVAEGLIDILCPYQFGLDAGVAELEMPFFCGLVKETDVLLLPYINTWRDSASSMLEHALQLARWPIDGYSVWDAVNAIDRSRQTAILSLGEPDTMRAAQERICAGPTHRPVITLGDELLNKYHFGWNY